MIGQVSICSDLPVLAKSFKRRLKAENKSPATAANWYRSLQHFFRWCVDDGALTESPMARMEPPTIPGAPRPVLSERDMKKLLSTCNGRDFRSVCNRAITVLPVDSGTRRGELAGLTVYDIDFETDVAGVMGRGRRLRHAQDTESEESKCIHGQSLDKRKRHGQSH